MSVRVVSLEQAKRATTKRSRSAKAPRPALDDARPVIRMQTGELKSTVDQAEQALIGSGCALYQRSGAIVSVGSTPMLTAHRQHVDTPGIFEVGEHRLLELMMSAARFEKFDARAGAYVAANAPLTIPKTLVQRQGGLRLPVLSGIINAPTIRDDGTLLVAPGYDDRTGLLFDPGEERFPSIPSRPSRDDALRALNLIEELISGFPFVTAADRSVAIAAFITAAARKSLASAPAFAFSAPTAGSGKSKLVDIMSVIATGREAGVIALGGNPEESEKRIAALLLAGCAVAIDNVDGAIGGDLLCQLLTQSSVRMRVLGRSETPELQTNVMVTITGNNLSVDGDMTRRTLLCRLDPKVERPELREFDFEPVARAKTDRGALLVACLVILRAYHVAGREPVVPRLGSFEDWSDLVRSALLWLGCADPVETMEASRAHDPQRERLLSVMLQWRRVIGGEPVSAVEAVRRASERRDELLDNGRRYLVNPDFFEALLAVAGFRGSIEITRLGTWLGTIKAKIIEGMSFNSALSKGTNKWRLTQNAEGH